MKSSKKIQGGGRRITVDIGAELSQKLDQLRIVVDKKGGHIKVRSITSTIEELISKARV